MIVLTQGINVIDIVKTAEQAENGLLVTRWNDKQLVYGMQGITQTVVETVPDVDYSKLYGYTFENGVFARVGQEQISKWDFRQRMTNAEKIDIGSYEIVINNQAISDAEKIQRKMIMKAVMDDYDAATVITLNDPTMVYFASAVAGCGIISAERIAEILVV